MSSLLLLLPLVYHDGLGAASFLPKRVVIYIFLTALGIIWTSNWWCC